MTSALKPCPPRYRLQKLAVGAICLFGSMASASAANLLEIYEQSRNYDATIQAAFHDLESARLNIPIARSSFRPQLDFSGSAGLTDFNSDQSDTFFDSGLQIQLSQTLFNRESAALIDQAQIGVMQAEALYASQSQNLILRVATAYFDVLRADANVEFSQSELQAIARQREQAERRFDVGLIPVTDVRTAQALYDLAIAQEIAASNQLQNLRGGMSESGEIGLVATIPLFTGGRIKAEIAQAQADWMSAAADLEAQERSAVQQARDGYRGVVASIARARALNQALVSTQQSADAVEAGFRAGTRTSVEVAQVCGRHPGRV